MLDLKKLEENLDKALANQTSESLISWLQKKDNWILKQANGLSNAKLSTVKPPKLSKNTQPQND